MKIKFSIIRHRGRIRNHLGEYSSCPGSGKPITNQTPFRSKLIDNGADGAGTFLQGACADCDRWVPVVIGVPNRILQSEIKTAH